MNKKGVHLAQSLAGPNDTPQAAVHPGPVFIWGQMDLQTVIAQLAKDPPAMRETWLGSLGWEDPLEKGKATYSSILAWRIPWAASMKSQRVGHD